MKIIQKIKAAICWLLIIAMFVEGIHITEYRWAMGEVFAAEATNSIIGEVLSTTKDAEVYSYTILNSGH